MNLVYFNTAIKSANAFWCESEAAKLRFVAFLLRAPQEYSSNEKTLISQIIDWPSARDTGDSDSSYGMLCSQLWQCVVGFDSGCSSTNESYYQFVSDMIVAAAKSIVFVARQQKIQRLKDDIAKKQAELARLQNELGTVQTTTT